MPEYNLPTHPTACRASVRLRYRYFLQARGRFCATYGSTAWIQIWSELLHLPYWGFMVAPEGMHNFFLGDLQHHCQKVFGKYEC